MLYLNKFGLLLIYGGKNNSLKESAYLSDCYILRLSNLNWVYVNYFKDIP